MAEKPKPIFLVGISRIFFNPEKFAGIQKNLDEKLGTVHFTQQKNLKLNFKSFTKKISTKSNTKN